VIDVAMAHDQLPLRVPEAIDRIGGRRTPVERIVVVADRQCLPAGGDDHDQHSREQDPPAPAQTSQGSGGERDERQERQVGPPDFAHRRGEA
jgi:hypothetical protein